MTERQREQCRIRKKRQYALRRTEFIARTAAYNRANPDRAKAAQVRYAKRHPDKFTAGMTWDNYGEWQIDHKTACARFDLTDPSEQRKCFHFSNLQPLWKIDNLRKGDR